MNTVSKMVLVEYVGAKDSETDHLYGTGIVWTGRGDVQEVPAANWSRMKKHVDVWREVSADAGKSSLAGGRAQAPAPSAPASPNADGLDGKTREELLALCAERGLHPHPNTGIPKLLEALRAPAGA